MAPYFRGYIMAERTGTRWVNGCLMNTPVSPHKRNSASYEAWFAGVTDRAYDQQPRPKVLKYDK